MKLPKSTLKVSKLPVVPDGYTTAQRPPERTRPNARLTPGATVASGFATGRQRPIKPFTSGPLLGAKEV